MPALERIFYLSHLGADRAAGFPVLKAKGIAEEYIRKSGVPYTILRGSILFGPGDEFTTGLAMLLAAAPGFLPLPSKGETLVQPLWVEDLVTCLIWALDNPETVNRTYDIGGSEYLSLRQVVGSVMEVTRQPRLLVNWPTQSMRALTDPHGIHLSTLPDLDLLDGLPGCQPHLPGGYHPAHIWPDAGPLRLPPGLPARRPLDPPTAPHLVHPPCLSGPSASSRHPKKWPPLRTLQRLVWSGPDIEVVPKDMLLAVVHNGGLAIGAFVGDELVGACFRFPRFLHHSRRPAPETPLAPPGCPSGLALERDWLCPQTCPVADGPQTRPRSDHLDVRPSAQSQCPSQYCPPGCGLQHLPALRIR